MARKKIEPLRLPVDGSNPFSWPFFNPVYAPAGLQLIFPPEATVLFYFKPVAEKPAVQQFIFHRTALPVAAFHHLLPCLLRLEMT